MNRWVEIIISEVERQALLRRYGAKKKATTLLSMAMREAVEAQMASEAESSPNHQFDRTSRSTDR
jgi:hypothetical protein